jgi:protein transport protein SEC24
MLVVSDVDDVFLPKPTDLLVNLAEARQALESLLGRLNDMFQENHTVGSALGPALQAGYKLMVRTQIHTTSRRFLIIRKPTEPHWW